MQFVNGNEVVSGNAETRSIICEVTTTAAGQLIEKLEELGTENGCAKEEITELTISGPVNREDLQALQPFEKITKLDMREMTIIDEFGNETTEFPDHSLANFASPAYVYTPNSAYIIRSYAFYNSNIIGVYMHDNTYLLDTGTFNDCKMLTDVRLSDKLEDFGLAIFQGCSSLTSIELPPTLKTIRGGMFAGCGFTTFTIPETVTVIAQDAFRNCSSLEEIRIPESLAKIGPWAFRGCVNLKSMFLPNNISVIHDCVFAECESLENVEMSNRVSEIGAFAFNGCKNLESIWLPNTVMQIGKYAFSGCEKLKTVIVPDGVSSINERTFAGCTELEEIELPKTIKTIGQFAFQNCVSLKKIAIPFAVTYVDGFGGCTSLRSVDIPSKVTYLGDFSGCTNLESIKIPPSVVKIDTVFSDCPNLMNISWNYLMDNLSRFPAYQEKVVSSWKSMGKCSFCGGDIKKLGKTCRDCGKKKDY